MPAAIPSTMRAVRYHGPGQPLRLETLPVPEPGAGEVLVRIRAAGICHTELHFTDGLLNLGVAPLVLGHEIAGEVAAVGPAVTGVRPGDRVLVYYYVTCGRCHWCRTGRENLCPKVEAELGFITDGGYAEYVRVPARNLVPVPDSLTLEGAATLGCSATTAIHATRLAGVGLGDTVVVYGVGGVGLALVQLAKLAGARVLAVGRTPRKLDKALDLGADAVINAREEDVAAAVRRLTDGEGADGVFDLVGTAETMPRALACLRKRGRLVFIGYSRDPFTANTLQLVIDELVVTASVGNTLDELCLAVRLAGEGRLRPVIDRVVTLEEVPDTLEALRRGEVVGRAVAVP